MEAMEDENPTVEGVLRNIDFNNKERLPDSVLSELIIHFSKVPMGNSNLADPDVLGRAYEYLIEKFADDAGKKGGEFYTPKEVVKLIVQLIKPQEGMRICDPTVGSGGMLIQCAQYVKDIGGDDKRLSLFGQEKNLNTWTICKMNMLLHNYLDAQIEKGDTIRGPKLLDGNELMLFDRVIANPPFSLKNWGKKEAQNDPHGRFVYDIPPKSYGEMAFLQHMIATTKSKGMVGVVMPHGVLFRGNREQKIRKGILQDDLLEAVVGLPENLFYGTGIPGCILILNKDKPEERKGKVLFIHAAEEYESRSNQNVLREQDIGKIVNIFDEYKNIERYSRIVDFEEIKENDFVLNISRYVDTFEPEEEIDTEEAISELKSSISERDSALQEIDKYIQELGFESILSDNIDKLSIKPNNDVSNSERSDDVTNGDDEPSLTKSNTSTENEDLTQYL